MTATKLNKIYSSHEYIKMNDGTKLYVEIFGDNHKALPPIILCDGIGCCGYIWKYIVKHFAKKHKIIHFHHRGHGNSENPKYLTSIRVKTLVDDLNQILNYLDIDKAIFLGHSMGAQILLESYLSMKDKMLGLGLICGTYGTPLKTWQGSFQRGKSSGLLNWSMQNFIQKNLKNFIDVNHFFSNYLSKFFKSDLAFYLCKYLEMNHKKIKREDFQPYLEGLSQMDLKVFWQLSNNLSSHSAENILSFIDVPTLIISGKIDTFAPHWLSENMHQMIRGSDFLSIDDASHAAPIEHPDLINLRIDNFLMNRVHGEIHQQSINKKVGCMRVIQ